MLGTTLSPIPAVVIRRWDGLSQNAHPSFKVLIVTDDQADLARQLKAISEGLGHRFMGIARTPHGVWNMVDEAELVFVDVDLKNAAITTEILAALASADVTVLFLVRGTQTPPRLAGSVGSILRPILDLELIQAFQYAADQRSGAQGGLPPRTLNIAYPISTRLPRLLFGAPSVQRATHKE